MNRSELDASTYRAPQRLSLLALGGVGLAAALMEAAGAAAKAKSSKRHKKKCKNPCQAQVGQCKPVFEVECESSSDPEACKQKLLPCCDYLATCNARAMVHCIT